MANDLDISARALVKYEQADMNAEGQFPSMKRLSKIIAYLDIDARYLMSSLETDPHIQSKILEGQIPDVGRSGLATASSMLERALILREQEIQKQIRKLSNKAFKSRSERKAAPKAIELCNEELALIRKAQSELLKNSEADVASPPSFKSDET